jgi:hypothetical protein
MELIGRLVSCLAAIVIVAGCASTKVADRENLVKDEKLPRPDQILVYDFAATPADVPADSSLAEVAMNRPAQTPEEIALGRRVGADLATRLVEEIGRLGLPAKRASTAATPQINDIVIRGYLLSASEGSTAKRVAIGFGAGASEMGVAVEFYQMTQQGLRRLGSGTGVFGASKTPGGAVPVGVAIATANPVGVLVVGGIKTHGELSGRSRIEGRVEQATTEIMKHLKPRFREQGWIK